MFLFLHRLMQAVIVGLWVAGAWWLWTQRETARPLLDYYEVWEAAGHDQPPPLPRLKGTVTRAVSDTSLYLRDEQGRVWSVGLAGVRGIDPTAKDVSLRRLAAESRTNLHSLVGQPVELAVTVTNSNRTALGYLYAGTNQLGVAEKFVGEGRWQVVPEGIRPLPLKEQVRLRAAERAARSNGRGRWGIENATSPP